MTHTESSRTATHTDGDGATAGPAQRHGAGLFLLMECARPTAGGMRLALWHAHRVVIGRADRRTAQLADGVLQVGLPDRFLSSQHAELRRDGARWTLRDLGSRNGTLCNQARVTEVALQDGDQLELGHGLWLFRAGLEWPADAPAHQEVASPGGSPSAWASLDPGGQASLNRLQLAARGTLPVLLLGESGTGKEVLARAIHDQSGRTGAFVPVNCAALPAGLTEGLLFGHTRGSFTGAGRDEVGLIRASDGGTLFLDEIGDLPLTAQAALLRVLQEREVLPVGAVRPLPVDLRVIAATHRRLDLLSARGEFRADLYARLNGVTHLLPPLRDRLTDLGTLVAGVLPGSATDRALTLSLDAGRALTRHHWPLNIRELQQALLLASTLCTDGVIRPEHLPQAVRAPPAPPEPPPAPPPPRGQTSAGSEEPLRVELVDLLTRHQGNITVVAREMGKGRMQIHRWMKRFNLDPDQFR